MGKNHRHKKDLKAEKAKTKLKQVKTKFLPKGCNVTNTTFKVKPIVVAEQLKRRDEGDILSKRKLNVKDLLSRIKHYNENVRHSACVELADVIRAHTEEIVQEHLSQICLAVSSLMQDKDRKVRKAAARSIQIIVECVPSIKLVPFFEYFSTNLRCAMTNINKNVQEDSLLFLDCFIEKDCGLIAKTSDKLLPDFLSLISKLRSDSQLGRTLTLNLGSKMTSVAWRIKVLSRLNSVLRIILHTQEKSAEENKNLCQEINNSSYDRTFGIYKTKFCDVLDGCHFTVFSSTQSSFNNNSNSFNQHVMALVPLLHETWLEVIPEGNVQKQTEGTILNEETAALLKSVMNILYLLWEYIKQRENDDINLHSIFMNPENKKFLEHLVEDFPYSQSGVRVKKSKERGLNIWEHNYDLKCTQENLLLCFLYSVLYIQYPNAKLKKNMNSIITYMTKLLSLKKSLGDETMTYFMEFLKECFQNNYQHWRNSGIDLQLILGNAILFYDCGNISQKHRLELFHILSHVIGNEYLSKSPKFQQWLSNLPNLLCQPEITDATISQLLEVSKKNCIVFNNALINKLPDILDNLKNLNVVIINDSVLATEERVKQSLANIFFYIPRNINLRVIEEFISKDTLCTLKPYFEQMLYFRAEFNPRHKQSM